MHSARGKLLEYLLNACDAQDMVQITMSRDSLAKLLGVSRAALYRELASLQERDLILVQGRVVRIRNRHGMESLLNNAA
jgi:CRP-like cAMP-binding protein